MYVALTATWGLLVALIPHGYEGTAVFGRGSASLDYASTQFEAIANYLRLCFWPAPLILDYGTYKPTSFQQLLPYAIFIGLLVLVSVCHFASGPGLAFWASGSSLSWRRVPALCRFWVNHLRKSECTFPWQRWLWRSWFAHMPSGQASWGDWQFLLRRGEYWGEYWGTAWLGLSSWRWVC